MRLAITNLCLVLLAAAGFGPGTAVAASRMQSVEPDSLSRPVPVARVTAARLSQPVVVDGALDEPAWQQASPITAFIQRDPVEGAAPTESTVVRIVYDDEAIYIGAWLYDSAPDSIVARLGRRDTDTNSDRFTVYLDPYRDGRTGFYFQVDAAGSIGDGILLNDDWDDDSWDGVWEAKVRRDARGWTAEFRIPYSQLRFHDRERHVWGVNFRREIARKN